MDQIKVGILLSYDYDMLRHSLPCLYKDADRIWLVLDKNRKTWSGNDVEIPDSFFEWVKAFDTDRKIEYYEDDFAVPGLTPWECDVRERRMLHHAMGEGGWRIQIDTDEYFPDFGKFVAFLRGLDPAGGPYMVAASWLSLFKRDGKRGYLAVTNKERFAFASYGSQEVFRGGFSWDMPGVTVVDAPFRVIHQSWARSSEELWRKLTNWSHTRDFDIRKFHDFWTGLNRFNYVYVKNFHPLCATDWRRLTYLKAKDPDELVRRFAAGEYDLAEYHGMKRWFREMSRSL